MVTITASTTSRCPTMTARSLRLTYDAEFDVRYGGYEWV